MQKSHAFTFLNGKRIEQVFFSVNITVILLLMAIRYFFTIHISISTGEDVINFWNPSFISIFGVIPQLIITFTFPYQTFTKDYYGIAKYYQISLFETLKYYLTQVYSIRNLSVIFIIPLVGELIFMAISGKSSFQTVFTFYYSYIFSFGFIISSFTLTTLHKKWHLIFKIGLPIILYFTVMISLFALINVFEWWYIIFILLFNGIVGIVFLLIIKRRQKRMEV